MKTIPILFAMTLAIHSTVSAAGEGWTSDFEAAKKQAAKSGQDLLIDFTGSDWCGWCIKLNKEVFQHDPFKEGVKDKFVLVELDFPQDKTKVSEEVAEQNAELQQEYSVQGFPTILLTDAEGRPYAKTGYQPGGPEKYVEHLDDLRGGREARDEAFAKAEKAEGTEKATALVAALEAMELEDATLGKFYAEEIKQIKAADPDDTTGFGKRMESKARFAKFEGELNSFGQKQDHEGALALVGKTLEEGGLAPEDTQKVTLTRAMILAQQMEFDAAIEALDEAKAIAPDSEIGSRIDGFKEQLSAEKAKSGTEKPAAE